MKRRVAVALLLFAPAVAQGAMNVEVVRLISRPADVSSRATAMVSFLTGRREAFLFERPYAVAWDGEALLVADPGARRVCRIEGARMTTTADEALEQPVGVAACSKGIVVTDSVRGEVILFDRNLRKPQVLAQGLERPTGVVCRGDEVFVVVTGEHRLVALSLLTGQSRTLGGRGEGPAQFNFPAAIAAGDSALYVGDTLNFRVQQIDPLSGDRIAEVGGLGDGAGDTPRIKGLTVDKTGRLWISDGHLDRISVFGPDGRLLAIVGGPGAEAGQFSFPAGIAMAPDGRVAVADSLNRRVQILHITEDSRR